MFGKIAALLLCISGQMIAAAGTTSGAILSEDLGSSGAALSGACTSLSGDVTYLRYNPASLAFQEKIEFSTLYYGGGDLGINLGSITYGQKIGQGYAALNVIYMNAGLMDLNTSGGGSSSVTSEQDFSGGLSYAMAFDNIGAGLSVKFLSSTLIGSVTGTAFAADAGVLVKNTFVNGMDLGLAVLNIGTGLKYLDTAENLPATANAGASYTTNLTLREGLVIKLTGSLDGSYALYGGTAGLTAGLEARYGALIARAGVPVIGNNDTGIAAGIGFKTPAFALDYSAGFERTLSMTQRISLSLWFENPAPATTTPEVRDAK